MQKFIAWYLKFYPTSGVPLKRRIAIHACFWVVWGGVYYLSFISNSSPLQKIIITLSYIVFGVTCFYSTTYFAFPYLFSPKRFIWGILILFLIYCIHYLEQYGFHLLVLKYDLFWKGGPSYKYSQEYLRRGIGGIFYQQNIFREIYLLSPPLITTYLLKLSRVMAQYSVEASRIVKEKTKLEIEFLRSQIDPHFLLNSVNNIYSQLVVEDENAAKSVIVLSDMIKYMLYNSDETLVDLKQEIDFLKNYIDLEKLKGRNNLKINFSYEGDIDNNKIAPLILLSYVENAFKHVSFAENKISLIAIAIELKDEILNFSIKNDTPEQQNNAIKAKDAGLGLINNAKRLNLLYPQRHKLFLTENEHKFRVELMLKLTDN